MGDQTALLSIIAAFTFIAALALCLQAGFLYGTYKAAKAIEQKVVPLAPKVESLVDSTKTTLEQSRKQIVDLSTKANDILDSSKTQILDITTKANDVLASTKSQLVKIDAVVTDATARAKVQMERVEMVLDDTMSRTQETVATVNNSIMRPLREIHGIAVGIKTAFAYLARGNRPSVAQATSDEEMFI
jgi:isoleucyl-tRNA synthetase